MTVKERMIVRKSVRFAALPEGGTPMKSDNNGHAPSSVTKDSQHQPLLRRILLVEDDDVARRQLQKLLQVDPQIHVDAVEDGEQALKALDSTPYSIVITDLRMPGFDGMD